MKPSRMHMPYSCLFLLTNLLAVPPHRYRYRYPTRPSPWGQCLGPQPPLCALLSLQASGIDYRLGWRHGLEMMGEAAG